MTLQELLIKKREYLLGCWEDIILGEYAKETFRIFKKQKDQFANPVGHKIRIGMAELYLEASETEKAKAQLEEILRVFPSNAYAKLVLAEVLVAEGDTDNARLFLNDALDLWSGADKSYVHLKRAEEVLASLD